VEGATPGRKIEPGTDRSPLQSDQIRSGSRRKERRVERGLVERAQAGDSTAFDALARTVGDECMAIAFRILRRTDLAEDAVQTALVTAWRELRALRDLDRFEPWLHRILTRRCYAMAREVRAWSAQPDDMPIDGPQTGAEMLGVDDRDQLERAFRRLTTEQRTVLVFHHYLDLPVAEVADRLGIPVGTVKSRLHHAVKALRASIEADARIPATSQGRPT
jgi:RNA polymerase sigma-70 factor, ECF subfamily